MKTRLMKKLNLADRALKSQKVCFICKMGT